MQGRHTWNLFRLRGRLIKNHFTRPNADKVMRWVLIATFTLLFVWGDYLFFLRIIRYLDNLPLQIGEELIVQLINVMFLTLFAMILFSSIIASLAIFYISSDLDFLHSLPVSRESIIHVRFGQTLVNASWMMVVFALPMFVAYGNYFRVSPGYYGYLFLSFVPFVILPCFLGVSGILVLMRYFPTRRAYQILSFLGIFFLAGLVMFLRFLSPEKFFGSEVSDTMIMAFVESLRVPEYPFLPSSWITRGLTAWVAGDTETAWVRLGFLLAALAVLGGMFHQLARRIYFPGWQSYLEVRNAPHSRRRGSLLTRVFSWLPLSRQARALLYKDAGLFFRDPSQWSQLFILAALVVVYIFNILNLPLTNLVLKNVVSVLNIGLVGFVLSALISRFGFTATSVEGQRMWVVYTAPVTLRRFLWAKFWMYLPPLLLIGEFLVIVSNYLLEVDAYVMKVSILGVLLITVGLVGMGVGMGAMYPMFRYENVSEISSGTGGILFMLSSLSYVALVLIFGARPMYVHFKEKFLFESIGGLDVPVLYSLVVLLTLIVTFVPMRRGIRRLETMDL